MSGVKTPLQSSTILTAALVFAALVGEILLSTYVLKEALLTNESRVPIFMGAIALIGFRFKSNTAIKFVWILALLPLLAFSSGCASTTKAAVDIHADRMQNRVDSMKVIEAVKDKRGLILDVPRPTNSLDSLFSITLGWERETIGVAVMPLDENDTGRYMRGSNLGVDAGDNLADGNMDALLLIEVENNPDAADDADEAIEELDEPIGELDEELLE